MLGLFPNYEFDYMNYIVHFMKDEQVLTQTIKVCINCINSFFLGGLLVLDRIDYNKYSVRESEIFKLNLANLA